MILGAFFFAGMAVCVKFAAAGFNSAELVFYRGFLSMLLLWWLARRQGVPLTTTHPGMHAWRSLVGVISLGAWFYAIAVLPLATAITLNYMSSIWIAAFLIGGSLLAWNPVPAHGPVLPQGPLALTVAIGFAGVIMMLRPTLAQDQLFGGLVGLLAGLMAALAYLQVMALSKIGEPDLRIVFYFAVGSFVGGAIGMAFTGLSPWHRTHAAWLAPIALLATLGQLCLTRAYSHGTTLVVASLQYSGVVFGALFGLLLFGDTIALAGWLGMALIVVSGVAASALRARAAPNAPAEEH